MLGGLFAVVLLCVVAGTGSAQELSDADLKSIRWNAESQRTAYCKTDRHADDDTFDAPRWREANSVVRGTMLNSLICGTTAYGMVRREVIELLGPGEQSETFPLDDDPLVYRIANTEGVRKYEPPVPDGYREIPDSYDVRVSFDPENGKVIGFDVFPAIERDS